MEKKTNEGKPTLVLGIIAVILAIPVFIILMPFKSQILYPIIAKLFSVPTAFYTIMYLGIAIFTSPILSIIAIAEGIKAIKKDSSNTAAKIGIILSIITIILIVTTFLNFGKNFAR